jgi:uracil-DNA glycosylase family 4
MRNPDCRLCPLWQEALTVCMPGDGNPNAPIWVVGEAPGETEDERGYPFVGKSGRPLRADIEEAGFDWGDIHITNTVRCRPPSNRTPTDEEIKICSEAYLLPELRRHRPHYLVAVGNSTLPIAIRGDVERPHKTQKDKVVVEKNVKVAESTLFPILHPAYALRNPAARPLIQSDLQNLNRLFTVRTRTGIVADRYHFCTTPEQVKEAYKRLKDAPTVAFDIETHGYPDGLDAHNQDFKVLCISFSPEPGEAWVLAAEHPEVWLKYAALEGNDKTEFKYHNYVGLVREVTRRILEDPKRRVIAHNGLFDCTALRVHWGIRVHWTYDTMIAAHLLNENESMSLKSLAPRYVGVRAWSEEIKWGRERKPKGSDVLPPVVIPDLDKLMLYNARDTDYTLQLYEYQKGWLELYPNLKRLFLRLSMPAARAVIELQVNGVYLDRTRLEERLQKNRALMRQYEAEIRQLVPLDRQGAFKLQSVPDLRWLLFEHFQFPVIKMTPKGAISTDHDVLSALEEQFPDHPLMRSLTNYRKRAKYQKTYLEKWYNALSEDGYVYFSYNPTGTVTGRYSGDGQQVPRDTFLRSIIAAPSGTRLIEVDLSQIELRIMAELSGDSTLVDIYNRNGDVHLNTASEVLEKPVERVTKDERSIAKPVNFGYAYGMQDDKMVNYSRTQYGVSMSHEQAKEFRMRFFRAYPGILRYHREAQKHVHDYEEMISPIGRVRRLPDIRSNDRKVQMDCERQAVNNPVQGFGSDLMFMGLIRVQKLIDEVNDGAHPELGGPGAARVVMSLHDAIMLYVKEEVADIWAERVIDIMRNPPLKEWFDVELKVPLDAEAKIGTHWGE